MGLSASSCFDGLLASRSAPSSPGPDRMKFDASPRSMAGPFRGEVSQIVQEQISAIFSPPWTSPVPRDWPDATDKESPEFDLSIDEVAAPEARSERRAPSRSVKERPKPSSTFEVEQALASPGSLPQPLSEAQRLAIARQAQPLSVSATLGRSEQHVLQQATAEAQSLRRSLVAGTTVVFVSAGLRGKQFIFEKMASLGVNSIVIDDADSWSRELVDKGIISKFLALDMSKPANDVYQEALQQIEQLGNVDAITTFIELSVPLVSRLCERLGLPGMAPAAVDTARDKHATRAAMQRAGLPTPRNTLIHSTAELAAAGRHVGFPAVLKPVSGAASLGVKKVTSMEDLERSYAEVVEELGSLVVSSGALVKGGGNDAGFAADAVVNLTVLLEQYLDGCEVDIDVVLSDGQWRYAAVTDNGPTLEPYFNETWAVCPSLQPKQKQAALKELAVKSVEALGFEDGVFHVECKYTSTGPQLIEVNARMGGGQVRECNFRTWGVDLVEEQLFLSLGIPARPAVPSLPLAPVAYCYVNASTSGEVMDLACLDELRQRDGLIWAKPLVKCSDIVVGPEDGLPTWICDLCVTRPTAQEALEFLMEIQNSLKIRIRK